MLFQAPTILRRARHALAEGLPTPAWMIPGDESPGYNGGHPLKRVQRSRQAAALEAACFSRLG